MIAPTSAGGFAVHGAFCHGRQGRSDLEELGAVARHKEKRKRSLRFDRHKPDWRSGVFCHTAELAYDPRTWPLELDTKKSGDALIAPTSTGGLAVYGAFTISAKVIKAWKNKTLRKMA